MHHDSAYTKMRANSGVDQGCPLSACGFSAVVDPALRTVMAQLCTHYDSGAKLFANLDDWYLWIKPQCLVQTIAVITAATRSVNLALQSTKTQVWNGCCQDPIPPEFQHKVTLTLSCLGGHLQIHGDTEPSPVVLGEQATMEKTIQRFQKICPAPSTWMDGVYRVVRWVMRGFDAADSERTVRPESPTSPPVNITPLSCQQKQREGWEGQRNYHIHHRKGRKPRPGRNWLTHVPLGRLVQRTSPILAIPPRARGRDLNLNR